MDANARIPELDLLHLPHHNHHAPSIELERPHTVHAHSSTPALSFENEDLLDRYLTRIGPTPRPSTAWLSPADQQRRLSRDDTANNMHQLQQHCCSSRSHTPDTQTRQPLMEPLHRRDINLPNPTLPDEQKSFRIQRQARKSLSRHPSQASMTTTDHSASDSYARRFSKFSKDRVQEWREAMHGRYTPASLSQRVRRSSTSNAGECREDCSTASNPPFQQPHPTSPTKRSARQGNDRPRKQRVNFLTNDRKDTPAPSTATGLPMRPATSRQIGTIISAPGGDGARAAAAIYNSQISSCTSFNSTSSNWEHDDLISRRQRLGSLSSAADSGADLSTYCASHASNFDCDGDVTMSCDELTSVPELQQPFDFVKRFPPELSLQVFEYLEVADLLRAERVSKKWQTITTDTSVWRTLFLRKFQRRIMSDPPPVQVGGTGCGLPNKPNQEWRRMYKARTRLERNWREGAQDAGKATYLSGHTDSVYCLQFDEEKIITGSRDRTIRVWDINTLQCLKVIGAPQHRPTLGPKVLRTVDYPSFHMATASVNGTAYGDSIYHVPTEWHDASILCLQYDDKILVTGSSDSDLLIWDIKTFQPIHRLKKHAGGVLDVALDAKHIVSCSKDSRIIVWDRETFEFKGDLTGHQGPVNAVQLRGHLLVSASGDGIARLWDLNQMKLIKEFSAKERGLAAVEFSEDMKYVLAGGNDNITYKFETETGRELMQFTGHSQLVRSLWLDSANNRVVSGSYDLDLRVYDFVNGQELWRGEEWTTSWMLAAKSDYRRIVATSQDGRILIVDFGILKGPPTYRSRDGQPIEDVELLRGIEHDNSIKFTNPWDKTKSVYGFGV